jgi:hypothetical protein
MMSRRDYRVEEFPEPLSHYTDTVQAGELLFVSGIVSVDAEGKLVGGDDVVVGGCRGGACSPSGQGQSEAPQPALRLHASSPVALDPSAPVAGKGEDTPEITRGGGRGDSRR